MFVTAGLDPGIHDFAGTRRSVSVEKKKTWMAGSSPAMTLLLLKNNRTRRAPGCLAKRP
jgi:hypothetical protein